MPTKEFAGTGTTNLPAASKSSRSTLTNGGAGGGGHVVGGNPFAGAGGAGGEGGERVVRAGGDTRRGVGVTVAAVFDPSSSSVSAYMFTVMGTY